MKPVEPIKENLGLLRRKAWALVATTFIGRTGTATPERTCLDTMARTGATIQIIQLGKAVPTIDFGGAVTTRKIRNWLCGENRRGCR